MKTGAKTSWFLFCYVSCPPCLDGNSWKRGATNNTFVGVLLISDNVISSYTLFNSKYSGVNSMPVFFQDHCCILYSIIGWNCSIGMWSRIEGSRCDPNPNEEFSRPDGESLFGNDGKLTPSITILGKI